MFDIFLFVHIGAKKIAVTRLPYPETRINTGFFGIQIEYMFGYCAVTLVLKGVKMSEVLAKDIPIEQQFMTDFWKFRKKYYIPENSDNYWSDMCNSADALSDKYGRNQYMTDVIMACVNDFERRYRRIKNE